MIYDMTIFQLLEFSSIFYLGVDTTFPNMPGVYTKIIELGYFYVKTSSIGPIHNKKWSLSEFGTKIVKVTIHSHPYYLPNERSL